MTLQFTLPSELQERLHQEAERRGQPAEAVALRLLDEHLPPPLECALSGRHRHAAPMDGGRRGHFPGGASANEEFFRALDAARPSNRKSFPPELKGTF